MNIVILTYAKDAFGVASIDRLVEEATLRGHTISRVRYSECSLSIQAGVLKIYYRGKELPAIDAVIPWIIQGDFNYGMDVLRHFSAMGVYVLNSADSFEKAGHKWRTAQILGEHSIPTPDTYRSHNYKNTHRHIDGMINKEVVIKLSKGTRGNGVILAQDRDTAKAVASTLSSRDYIVQEFIAESRGVDTRAYVVGGRVVAAMERRANNEGFRSNLSLGGSGMAIELDVPDTKLVLKTAEALGLHSAGIDFIKSKKGLLILEANTSGEFGIEKITGVNVAAEIIEYVERSVSRRRDDKVGA